ncbi:hypothetical protein Tco_0584145 [Tanacetum coccineum]
MILHLTNLPMCTILLLKEQEDKSIKVFLDLFADLSVAIVRCLLFPTIQNILKDIDPLDLAHKEALEITVKERSGGTFDSFSKVIGTQFGLPTSVSSFFGEGGLLGKRDSVEIPPPNAAEGPKVNSSTHLPEDTRFRRIMRGGLTDMLRGKTKPNDDLSPPH